MNIKKECTELPEISLFYGIRITINWNDHVPPHFHARYGEFQCSVDIVNNCLLNGFMPKKQLKQILLWAEINEEQLMQDWELARLGKPLNYIDPLK
jgi:hypothetical protein